MKKDFVDIDIEIINLDLILTQVSEGWDANTYVCPEDEPDCEDDL